jgi:diguanylate cyclase (GGDEF)-like protein
MSYSDPDARRFEQMAGANPARAAEEIKLALANVKGTSPADILRKAAFYSTLAEALSALELDTDAKAAATAGIELLHDQDHPLYVNLLYLQAANTYDDEGIKAAMTTLDAALQRQVESSAANACLLIALGLLQHQTVRDDLASASLTHAYRMSATPDRARQRMHAAEILTYIVRSLGEYQQALALNQEVIDWYKTHDELFELATSRFVRGEILRYKREYQTATTEFEASRSLSVQMNDSQGVAFADLRLCNIKIELGELSAARTLCERAIKTFDSTQSASIRKEALTTLSDVDLREGNASRALVRLNEVLDQEGKDMLPRRVPAAYELRAKANLALGRQREAARDLTIFVERFKAVNDAEREQQSAVLRAQFEIDRQVERNATLQHELQIQNERLQIQAEELRRTIVIAVIGALAVALLTYLLLINRRQKQALTRLAEIDALTDLPNRRHMFALATRALETAAKTGATVTVAVVDLDHFKSINDRFGHAAGDYVLEQFAKAGRTTLRESDLLGRWGGEEFLVVLPNTELDTANTFLERLRTVALEIKSPTTEGLRVSISAGLATNEDGTSSLDDIVAQADAALYQAKNSGRDVVRIAEDSYSIASTGVRRALRGSGIHMNTGKFSAFTVHNKAERYS